MTFREPVSPLWTIVERHFDEAEFAFETWLQTLDAPDYSLKEVAAGPEQRLLAQLDGLYVAGRAALEAVIWPALDGIELGEALGATLSLAVLGLGEASEHQRLLALLDAEPNGFASGVRRGLELCTREGLDAWLQYWISVEALGGQHPRRLAALIQALAGRGRAPAELPQLLIHPDPLVLAASARAARHRAGCEAALARLAEHPDEQVRAEALESALILHLPGAWQVALCWALGPQPCGFRRRALTWTALLGDPQVHAPLFERLAMSDDSPLLSDLLWAAGLTGRPAALDHAVQHIFTPTLAPLVGEVFSAIAGLPTDDASLWLERPPPSEDEALPPLELDDLDADLSLNPVDLLPIPDPSRVIEWWQARRADLRSAPRLLSGRRWTPGALLEQLRAGPLRRSHALALELALRSGGQIQLNTRTWACRQLAHLATISPEALALHGDFSNHH